MTLNLTGCLLLVDVLTINLTLSFRPNEHETEKRIKRTNTTDGLTLNIICQRLHNSGRGAGAKAYKQENRLLRRFSTQLTKLPNCSCCVIARVVSYPIPSRPAQLCVTITFQNLKIHHDSNKSNNFYDLCPCTCVLCAKTLVI
jgi:hypothetical protein